jgi:hypothetical protein
MFEIAEVKGLTRSFRVGGVTHSFKRFEVHICGTYKGWFEIGHAPTRGAWLETMYNLKLVEDQLLPYIKDCFLM